MQSARFETTVLGRAVISGFLLVTLAAMLVANLPGSRLSEVTTGVADPFLEATGMDQSWSVFAPDPRRETIDIEARVTYADGHMATWRPPAGGDLTGAQWDYRWRKWMENAIQDAHAEALWAPAAEHVAREMGDGGSRPVSVTLIRRWRDAPPPGASGQRGPWKRYAFYTLPVASPGADR
jgi:hypothetical protein